MKKMNLRTWDNFSFDLDKNNFASFRSIHSSHTKLSYPKSGSPKNHTQIVMLITITYLVD